ncbi:hypothetical protein [Mesorhizobium sp. AR02]|uniref:hypothetical protein n=1 Tax=Mesorhizobium sp. AR02 TaxID=2865837 RepID=UPI00215E54D4
MSGDLKQIREKRRFSDVGQELGPRADRRAERRCAAFAVGDFLVVTVTGEQPAPAKVCSVLGELDDLVKTVGFRDLGGRRL